MIKKLLITVIAGGMLTMYSCKDEEGTPTTTTTKTCTVTGTTDSDNDNYDFTYSGGKLSKVVNTYDGETDNIIFTWDGDQLAQLNNGTYVLKMVYTGGTITRIDELDDNVLTGYYLVTMNSNKQITKLEYYYIDGTDEVLVEAYTMTYTGNNCSKVVNSFDSDEDGVLDMDISANITAFDSKTNPLYNMPMMFWDLGNYIYLSKNNATAANANIIGQDIDIKVTYTYNSSGLPTQSVMTSGADVTTTNYAYDCK
ncbi:MAG: hypothetical protein GC181_06380 [Bacteroidetes bacterium]|nr:hypothetical protein [Bacteroidota bacterium]